MPDRGGPPPIDEYMDTLAILLEGDTDTFATWAENNLTCDFDAHFHLSALASITAIFMNTKDPALAGDVRAGRALWVMQPLAGAPEENVLAAQILTRAFNDDQDTLHALVEALVRRHDGDLYGRVFSQTVIAARRLYKGLPSRNAGQP